MNEFDFFNLLSDYALLITNIDLETKTNTEIKVGKVSNIESYLSPVIQKLESNNFTSIVICGYQGSGKTTTAFKIAKYIQETYQDFIVASINALAINNENLSQIHDQFGLENLILILDDLSYVVGAMGRKESSLFKNLISTIRHVFRGKVLLIAIAHVPKGLPPILRNSDLWVFQSITDELLSIKAIDKTYKNYMNTLNSGKDIRLENKIITKDPDSRIVYIEFEDVKKLVQVNYINKKEIKNYVEIIDYDYKSKL